MFVDAVASPRLNIHGESLGRRVTLVCLRQSTRMPFMGWLLDTSSFVPGLNASIVVLVVEHEKYLAAVDLTSDVVTTPTWLASYFLV